MLIVGIVGVFYRPISFILQRKGVLTDEPVHVDEIIRVDEIMLGLGLLLAGTMSRYIFLRLRTASDLVYQLHGRICPGVEVISSKEEFVDRLKELVDGSLHIKVFDLSTPHDADPCVKGYLNYLRGPLQPGGMLSTFQRISGVRDEDELLWTVRTASEFKKFTKITHLCVTRDRDAIPSRSYYLIQRDKDDYYVIFYGEIGACVGTKAIVIHNAEIGKFMEKEFERTWATLAGRDEPILERGRINKGQVEKLCRKLGVAPEVAEGAMNDGGAGGRLRNLLAKRPKAA